MWLIHTWGFSKSSLDPPQSPRSILQLLQTHQLPNGTHLLHPSPIWLPPLCHLIKSTFILPLNQNSIIATPFPLPGTWPQQSITKIGWFGLLNILGIYLCTITDTHEDPFILDLSSTSTLLAVLLPTNLPFSHSLDKYPARVIILVIASPLCVPVLHDFSVRIGICTPSPTFVLGNPHLSLKPNYRVSKVTYSCSVNLDRPHLPIIINMFSCLPTHWMGPADPCVGTQFGGREQR